MSDIIKMLLQATVDPDAIKNIQDQLNGIQTTIKPININVNTTGAKSVSNMTDALDKLENVTKRNLMLDLDRMSNRYKDLVKPEDVTNIRNMINSLSHTDPKLGYNIDLIKVKMKEVSVGAEQSRRALDLANKSAMTFGEAMKQAAYKFGIWSTITASYYKLIREISTGITYITEMDTALTEIGMVTNQTREQTAQLAREYNNLAKEMKVLTSEITSGAVEFYRQGLSQEEVMERLRVTTMYSKVANLEFKQSAEILTATVNSMGVSIEKSADIFAYLGDATATGADEIGIAFSKTGGAAAALNVEFEKVASWIAVISSRTRESAESIGHSINTMLSRMSRITTTGFDEEDGTKLNDVAKALSSIGVALMDQSGNFRDFGTIMDEVGAKFNSLNDKQKSYVANAMAGTRQQSRFYNLMEGYSESISLYEKSLEAAGTAQSKFNLYLESNQATLDTFRTTIEGFWTGFLDSDILMDAVRMATSFVETLDNMMTKFGSLGGLLSIIIPLIGIKLVWAIRSAYLEMVKLQATGSATAFMPTAKVIGQIIAQMLGLKVAAGSATIAVNGLTLASAGLTLGLGALIFIFAQVANAANEAEQAMANSLERSQKLADDIDVLENLSQKYDKLTEKESQNAETKEELLKIQRELAQLFPELATGVDAEGNKIAENTEEVRKLIKAKEELLEQEMMSLKFQAEKEIPSLQKQLDEIRKDKEDIQRKIASGDTFKTVITAYGEFQRDISDDLHRDNLRLINEEVELQQKLSDKNKIVEQYNQLIDKKNKKEQESLSIQNQAKNNDDFVLTQTQSITDLYETVSTAVDEYDLFTKALKELNEEGQISKSTLDKLIEIYPDIISQTNLQKDSLIDLMNASKNRRRQIIDDEIATAKKVMESNVAKILSTKDYAEALTKLAQIQLQQRFIESGLMFDDATIDNQMRVNVEKARQAMAIIEQTNKQIQALNGMRSLFDEVDKGKTSTKSSKDEYSALSDRYLLINQQLDKNNVLLEKNRTLQALAGDDLAKKIPLMEEEIRLNEERKRVLHDLNNEQRKEMQELEKTLSGQGFKFAGTGDNRIITNLDNIKGKTKEVEEQFKRYIDLQSKLIPKVSQDWMDLSSAIQKTGLSLQDAIRNSTKELIELEKRNAYMDLELRQRVAQEQLNKSKAKMEKEVSEIQGWIDRLQSEIDDIQETERARQENLERSRRQEEISQLQNKYYYLQYVNLANITEEQAKLVGLEKEREQYLERQAKLQELQIKLENIRNEKNIQQLTKLQDGSFDFTYVADEREIDNINKQIEDLQTEHNKSLKDLKDRTLEDLKKAQESYDEWEYQNDIRRQIETKQRRITNYQDEIKDLQDKYAELERLTNEAFAREKENLDRYYMDIDMLTDSAMKNLHDTLGENWSNIQSTLSSYFTQIANEYDALVRKLSTPLPTQSSSGGGGFYSSPSGGGTFTGGYGNTSDMAAKGTIDQYIRDWWEADARGDSNAKEIASKNADAIRQMTGLDNYGKTQEDVIKILGKNPYVKKYSTGIEQGLVTDNHLAILHGSKTNWEGVFTKNQLSDLLKNAVASTIKVFTPSVPKVALANSGGGDNIYYINELKLPSVTDFDSFVRDFNKNVGDLPNKAIMRVKKIGK